MEDQAPRLHDAVAGGLRSGLVEDRFALAAGHADLSGQIRWDPTCCSPPGQVRKTWPNRQDVPMHFAHPRLVLGACRTDLNVDPNSGPRNMRAPVARLPSQHLPVELCEDPLQVLIVPAPSARQTESVPPASMLGSRATCAAGTACTDAVRLAPAVPATSDRLHEPHRVQRGQGPAHVHRVHAHQLSEVMSRGRHPRR